MPVTGSPSNDSLLTACRKGANAAAVALEAAFESKFTVSPPEIVRPHDPARPDPAWRGPGLIFTIPVAGGAASILLPNAEGLIPAWCAEPDAAGEGRLLALARELATQLLPQELAPADFDARWVSNLAAAIGEQPRDQPPGQNSRAVSLPLSAGNRKGVLSLIVPLAAQTGASMAAPKERLIYERIEDAIPHLPVYSRSLLKIKVPVRVTLAATKLPVRKIVELSPGTLIQFPKLCEEPLDLEVGQRPVARGEAVKIGEKFGLRVTSIIMPGERFVSLAPSAERR
jgi:flagellar motor switch/type III secretory pathway protein FliN